MDTSMTCSEASRATNEVLAGTVKPSGIFFLIENSLPESGGWGSDAVKSAAQAGPLAPGLQRLQTVHDAKILFIRQPRSQGKRFYVGLTNQPEPRLYQTELSDYADLLGLDIDSLGPGQAPRLNGSEMSEVAELYTVCANGRHDPCCAKHGMPVFQEMVAQAGRENVWQTTHIGGHRMAATMIAFPHGIVYGHVDPPDVEAIISNQRAGFMLAHKYRGRGAFAGHELDEAAHKAACAAEAVMREQLRSYRIADLRLDAIEANGGDEWMIRFLDADGAIHAAHVRTEMSAPRPTSCGDPPKPMPEHDVALLEMA